MNEPAFELLRPRDAVHRPALGGAVERQSRGRPCTASTAAGACSRHSFSGITVGPPAPSVDVLATNGEVPLEGPEVDQVPPATVPTGPAPPGAGAGSRAPTATPTNMIQILTSWNPGATEYGFQLSFRCRSTSGDVTDLQAQAPNLIWREHVTYSRNDFAHRIAPPNPTILPAGGVGFDAASTHVVGTNLLEFTGTTDTHHLATSNVVAADFVPTGTRALPAVMESHQLYQFSPDGGGSWHYLAGSFTIRRTLFRDSTGALQFRTQKTGIHAVTEPFKP